MKMETGEAVESLSLTVGSLSKFPRVLSTIHRLHNAVSCTDPVSTGILSMAASNSFTAW